MLLRAVPRRAAQQRFDVLVRVELIVGVVWVIIIVYGHRRGEHLAILIEPQASYQRSIPGN